MLPTEPDIIETPTEQCRHPGELLGQELAAHGMSVAGLARASGLPPTHLAEVVASRRAVTPEIALCLADHLGRSARFWLNRQAAYDAARLGVERRPKPR